MSASLLQPMTESDLEQVEEVIGRPLPTAFRNAMLNFPQQLIDAAVMADSDGNEYVDCMMISPVPEFYIASINGREREWPSHLLVVGENGCGEHYSVDISR